MTMPEHTFRVIGHMAGPTCVTIHDHDPDDRRAADKARNASTSAFAIGLAAVVRQPDNVVVHVYRDGQPAGLADYNLIRTLVGDAAAIRTTLAGQRFWRSGYGAVHQGFASPDPTERARFIQDLLADIAQVPWATVWADSATVGRDPRVDLAVNDYARMLADAVAVINVRSSGITENGTDMFAPTADVPELVVIIDTPDILHDADGLAQVEHIVRYGRRTGVAVVLILPSLMLAYVGSEVVRAAVKWEAGDVDVPAILAGTPHAAAYTHGAADTVAALWEMVKPIIRCDGAWPGGDLVPVIDEFLTKRGVDTSWVPDE